MAESSSTAPAVPETNDVAPPAPSPSKPAASESSPCTGPCLSSALANTDYTVRRLKKLISTSSGQESVLSFTQYSARVLHHVLSSAPSTALLARLRLLLGVKAAARSKKPPSDTPPLLLLYSLISETRMSLRLLGLIGLWTWGSDTFKSPPSDPVFRAVAFSQVLVNVAFQILENIAYLASKGILNKRAVEKWCSLNKLWLWSTRAWLGHILLEFVRLARARQLAAKRSAAAGAGDKTLDKAALEAESRAWKKGLVKNAAWAPLCLHWSLENGLGLSSAMIGVFGVAANAWGIADQWKATA
ncbi:hypothetical protein VTO42DRAFT_3125 [Malbranchea cinnamomea]